MSNKLTKKDYLTQILDFIGDSNSNLSDFVNKEIAALDARSAKAKEKAAAKKAETDALYEAVYAAIGTDNMTIEDILDAVHMEDATRGKVVARLTKLKDAGLIVKVEGKPVTYHRA